MHNRAITLDSTIAEIMELHPDTIPVFLEHRMICVGCQMAIFDTLEDALRNYGYPPEQFLGELNQISEADLSVNNDQNHD